MSNKHHDGGDILIGLLILIFFAMFTARCGWETGGRVANGCARQ